MGGVQKEEPAGRPKARQPSQGSACLAATSSASLQLASFWAAPAVSAWTALPGKVRAASSPFTLAAPDCQATRCPGAPPCGPQVRDFLFNPDSGAIYSIKYDRTGSLLIPEQVRTGALTLLRRFGGPALSQPKGGRGAAPVPRSVRK